MHDVIALLGSRDQPTDALRDYCHWLGQALSRRGVRLETVELDWERRGWLRSLWRLWKQSRAWRGRWVLAQYTALAWSRRGFPLGFLAAVRVLRLAGSRCAVVYHDARAYGGRRLVDRARRACQQWVMRAAYRCADRAILTVPVEQVRWLPRGAAKAAFIPVGANLPEAGNGVPSGATERSSIRTVAVFGVTGGVHSLPEVADISAAVRRVKARGGDLRLVVLGRGSSAAETALRRELNGAGVELSVLGLLAPTEVARALAAADALLFVRGEVSSRRGSAIAGIACGLPLVGYRGAETASPITEAGVLLVPQGDREALAAALDRVLAEDRLRDALRQRSREAQRRYFSWEVIAGSFLKALGHEAEPE